MTSPVGAPAEKIRSVNWLSAAESAMTTKPSTPKKKGRNISPMT